jgi:hypothetical protein
MLAALINASFVIFANVVVIYFRNFHSLFYLVFIIFKVAFQAELPATPRNPLDSEEKAGEGFEG